MSRTLRFAALCALLLAAAPFGAAVRAQTPQRQATAPAPDGEEPAASRTPTVTARVEPDSIGIGDRFEVIVEVERDQVQVVEYPEFEPSEHVEVVASPVQDTLAREGRRLRLRKRYVLQAFDEGRYNLGRMSVLYFDKNIADTLYAGDSLRLQVGTFQIDTTRQTLREVKGQRTLPFRAGEVSGYVAAALLVVQLLAAGIWFLHRYLARRGRRLGDLFKPAPPLPPHVAAIRALEELHHQKLWQNNRHKLYYSGLTDILRRYLSGRYGFGAMEMTSDEILAAVRPLDLPAKCAADLTALLREADLVKFAKATPGAEENEEAYLRAYYFVEETKPVEEHSSDEARREAGLDAEP